MNSQNLNHGITAIELIPNANANIDCKVYPLNQAEQEELGQLS